jgi:tetratricopeptide (TPR) repeat protein
MCPGYLEANVKIGTLHLRAGRYPEAARWFSFALEINDRLLGAYVGIGAAQHAAGREEEAMASFDMARNIEPNSTLLFSEVARMQLKAAAGAQVTKYFAPPGDPFEADQEAMQSPNIPLADDDLDPPVTDLLGDQIRRLRAAIEQKPNHADLHYRLGLLLRNRGQVEDAIAAFEQAVAINPTYMKALIKLGLSLREVDRTDEAIKVFRQAVEVKPDYVDLHYQLGLLFAQRHQFELAVEQYELAAAGNPHNVSLQANLALALQSLGLIDRAIATWQVIHELAPDSEYAEQARRVLAKNRDTPGH